MPLRLAVFVSLALCVQAKAQPFVVNLQNVENDERTAKRFERDQLAPRIAGRVPLRVVANRGFHTPEDAFFEVTQAAPRVRNGVNEFDVQLTITGAYRGRVLLQDTYREVSRDKQAVVDRALAKFAVGIAASYDRLHPPVMVARPPLPPPVPAPPPAVVIPDLGILAAVTPVGAQILRVDPGGAAQVAGLLPQDVILWIDGIRISSTELLTYALGPTNLHLTLTCARGNPAGPQFSVSLHRTNGRLHVHKPAAWYKRPGERGYGVVVGQPVVLAEIGATAVVEPDGIRITSLLPESLGVRLGLSVGDLVQSIDGRPVYTAEEARIALSAGSVHFVAGLRGSRSPVPFQARLKFVSPGRFDIDRVLSLQTTIRLGGPARPALPPVVPPPPVGPVPPAPPPGRIPPPPPVPPQ